ncbi:PH domain-containing protein [Xiamenia xianingshaonis]|uniref:PH domain-containing protein n=1 Tax=Xiamenia xianingshaonis TaxID=2682776 RepID=A0A9E6SU79_9ACTN|nr:PH domain-containing protein [Xiamenia xianingshaonis]NGM17845.1 PH domain-containing protein [Eggerthellaceae bacterium zg-893]NHM14132.1 PH domain-containing protein [Xiamenia xianingshaonis]NHM16301.1 PH domain-containing protein [Xiamenia xianingshaonis]QTU83992.1 PH domain-containing protein [Xiamenia xianingshaonis]
MKELPVSALDPKIKTVWRINDALWLTVSFVACAAFAVMIAVVGEAPEGWLMLWAFVALYVAGMVLCLVVLPPIRYARWRYDLSAEYLDIARGIVWRKRFIVPFIRVQNTDTRQGPILRLFGLASVTVATAAGEHEIPGLDAATAESVRDRAAEFARLAREDV